MSFVFFPAGPAALDAGASPLARRPTKLAPLAGAAALVVAPLSFRAMLP